MVLGLVFFPAARVAIVLVILAIMGYVVFDNVFTENTVAPQTIKLERVVVSPGNKSATSPSYQLSTDIFNSGKVDVESVRVKMELMDCPTARLSTSCQPLAREVQDIQVLAGPREVKATESWFYFQDVIPAKGNLIPLVSAVSATTDSL